MAEKKELETDEMERKLPTEPALNIPGACGGCSIPPSPSTPPPLGFGLAPLSSLSLPERDLIDELRPKLNHLREEVAEARETLSGSGEPD